MIKEITIGQYFPGNSVIHRLDARVKIVLTIVFLVIIFMCKNFVSFLVSFVLVLLTMLLSKVPVKMYMRNIKAILPILIFTSVLNVFYVRGGTELLNWHFIHVTTKGIYTAVFISLRLILLIIASSALTYTTTPTMLTDALERLLSPLTKLHIDVHTFAMMMTLALRFIPTLIEEIDRIMNAQKARGADLETGSILQRAKALVPIIVPLIVSSVKRAYELASAMECRCYNGGEGRTRMKKMKISVRDFATMAVFAVSLAGVVILNRLFGSVM